MIDSLQHPFSQPPLPLQEGEIRKILTPNVFTLAGGQAVDSQMQRMLEVVPQHIHDRSGIFMGSYDEVQNVIAFHRRYSDLTS